MSTVSVQLAKRIAEESSKLNRSFISAPVMGRPDVAEAGQLIVMAAGKRKIIEKCKPVFDVIGKATHTIGDAPEQANVFKLSANFMLSSLIETFSEAFALVRKHDVDHHLFYEVMAKELFASPVYEKYGKIMHLAFESECSWITQQHIQVKDMLKVKIHCSTPGG